MTRTGLVDLVARRLDLTLGAAHLAVDTSVPREAYDEWDEIGSDDVELWINRIEEDVRGS